MKSTNWCLGGFPGEWWDHSPGAAVFLGLHGAAVVFSIAGFTGRRGRGLLLVAAAGVAGAAVGLGAAAVLVVGGLLVAILVQNLVLVLRVHRRALLAAGRSLSDVFVGHPREDGNCCWQHGCQRLTSGEYHSIPVFPVKPSVMRQKIS